MDGSELTLVTITDIAEKVLADNELRAYRAATRPHFLRLLRRWDNGEYQTAGMFFEIECATILGRLLGVN